jgi:hypothetical protein
MDDLQKSKLRSLQYWYVDGVSEIGTGIVVVLMGGLNLVMLLLPERTWTSWLLGLGQPLLILAAFIIMSRLVQAFKERVTYPRTGYVGYFKPKGNVRITRAILVGAVAAGISILVTLIDGMLNKQFVPLFMAALLCLALVIFAWNYGVKRFYLLGVYVLLLGAAFAIIHLPEGFDYVWLFIFFGAGWVLTGTTALVHYLRTTQAAETEDLE